MRPDIVVLDDDPMVLKGHSQFERIDEIAQVQVYNSRPQSREEVVQRAGGCHTLVLLRHHVPFDAGLLAELNPTLKHLAVWGVGLDHIDVQAADELGITVSHTPGASTQAVAEHCFTLLLAVMRSINQLDADVRAGKWPSAEFIQLSGKTMGVIGTGRIGSRVGEMAISLGMKVIAYDIRPNYDLSKKLGFEYHNIEALLKYADVITLHVPANEQTYHMISSKELSRMKESSILINVARGSVVDESSLVDALKAGDIRGAGLDVFEEEPIPGDHPILNLENTVLTPHVADKVPEAVDAGMKMLVDNIISYLEDGYPVVSASVDP